MAAMHVEYEGQTFVFDLEDMDTDDAVVMEQYGIPNLKALAEGMVAGDRPALTFAFWLMKKQDGAKVRIDQVNFKPMKFIRALDEATLVVDVEADGPKDPKPTGRKSKDS